MAKAEEVIAALRLRYPTHTHVFIEQVGETVGFKSRRADAIVMSLWKSRGLCITGIEVKVGRSDWLAELRNPAKAEPLFELCDEWWLAAGQPDLVSVDELPVGWGLMELHGTEMRTKLKPPRKDFPQSIPRDFLAEILRRCQEQAFPEARLKEEYQRGHDEAWRQHEEIMEDRRSRWVQDAQNLRDRVAIFEEASGVRIDGWVGPEKIGEAVRLVLSGGLVAQRPHLERLRDDASRITEQIEKALALIPKS